MGDIFLGLRKKLIVQDRKALMDEKGYRTYLESRQIQAELIEQHISTVERLEDYLSEQQPPLSLAQMRGEIIGAYIENLAAQGADSYDQLLAMARYAYFSQNLPAYQTVLELLDGAEAMGNLHRRVGEVLGTAQRDVLYKDLPLPTLGTSSKDKASLMRTLMERLEQTVNDADCTELFASSLRDLPDAWYEADKKRFQDVGDINRYLDWKRQDFIANLERLRDTGQLFFNQPITDEVIEFVRTDPEISVGVLQGNTLYVTKIPYLAQKYLDESDPQKKRYLYCHCPWARESLRQAEGPVPGRFCQCSAGYHKKSWELIFEQPLKADVLESVLQGDLRCRFAIHLPIGTGIG